MDKAPFKCLSLGVRFTLPGSAIWVKIGPDLIAEWDPREITTTWIGQRICSFSDNDDDLDTIVEVVE